MVLFNIFAWVSTKSVAPALVPATANRPEPLRKNIREKARKERNHDYLTIVHPMTEEEAALADSGKQMALSTNSVQKLRNGQNLTIFENGSGIMRGDNGEILWTVDVNKEKRQYMLDEQTGALLIKKFGVWSELEDGFLDQFGTLSYSKGDFEIEEHLDGVHVQRNRITGVTIQLNHLTNSELVKLPSNEIHKRDTCDIERKETFVIWKNGQLAFKSQTHFDTTSHELNCPSGRQNLSHVYRLEQSWQDGSMVEEKITFQNKTSNGRAVSIALEFDGNLIKLEKVSSIESKVRDEEVCETTYVLETAMQFNLVNGHVSHLVKDIAKVRCVADNDKFSISFESKDGTSLFTATEQTPQK